MSLLECLIGMSISMGVLVPVLQSSSHLLIQQTQLERAWLVEQDANRVLELMSRAIRMAGYREIASLADYRHANKNTKVGDPDSYLGIEYRHGWNHSDLLWTKQEAAGPLDSDCVGNTVPAAQPLVRTQRGLRHQRFFVQGAPGKQDGALMCASLDRQGRLHHTSLMQHVRSLHVELPQKAGDSATKGVWIYLKTGLPNMPDRDFSRFVAFRNRP